MRVRFNNSRYDFGYKGVINDLLSNNFRDLPRNRYLEISIGLTDNPDNVFLHVGVLKLPGFNLFPEVYCMNGNFLEDILDEENLESILKGAFGHELSHIAKGHHGWRVRLSDSLVYTPMMGEKLTNAFFEGREKVADRETIKRGLGQELYYLKLYSDSIGKPYAGYTSHEMQSLLPKLAH